MLQNLRKALSSLLQSNVNLAAPSYRKEEVFIEDDEPVGAVEDDDVESLSPSVSPSENGGYWPRKPLPPGGIDFEKNSRYDSMKRNGFQEPNFDGTLRSNWNHSFKTNLPLNDISSQNVKQEYVSLI